MSASARLRLFAAAVACSAAACAGVLHRTPRAWPLPAEATVMALVFVAWPLLYAALVGWRMRPVRPLLIAVGGGVVFGHAVLAPAEMHLWHVVEDVRWVASGVLLVAELWTLWLLLSSLARLRASEAPDDAMAGLVAEHLGPGVLGRLLVVELRMWFYALLSWRRTAPRYAGDVFYTTHRHEGNAAALQGVLILLTAELPIVHGLVWLWSPTAAWIVSALSLYGLVWMVAEYRAVLLRPVSMDAHWLYLRYGVMADERIPLQAIAGVRPWTQRLPRRAGLIQHRAGGRPNVRIELHGPTPVDRLLGTAAIDTVVLALDTPVAFAAALTERLKPAG